MSGKLITSIFQVPAEIAAVAPSSVGLVLADIHGHVHVLNKSFNVIRSWQAHINGRVTHMVARNGILITLGVSSPSMSILDSAFTF